MGNVTKITWCDHTFNPWIGCTKASDGCKFCYAETYGRRFDVQWGPQGVRRRTSASNWRNPAQWDKELWEECVQCRWRGSVRHLKHVTTSFVYSCPQCGGPTTATRQRVFCASLADVFEDNAQLVNWRLHLWALIDRCQSLIGSYSQSDLRISYGWFPGVG